MDYIIKKKLVRDCICCTAMVCHVPSRSSYDGHPAHMKCSELRERRGKRIQKMKRTSTHPRLQYALMGRADIKGRGVWSVRSPHPLPGNIHFSITVFKYIHFDCVNVEIDTMLN